MLSLSHTNLSCFRQGKRMAYRRIIIRRARLYYQQQRVTPAFSYFHKDDDDRKSPEPNFEYILLFLCCSKLVVARKDGTDITPEIEWLANGPNDVVRKFKEYNVHGFKFHTVRKEK